MFTRMLAYHDVAIDSHELGLERLIGGCVGHDAVYVNPGLVRERIASDDRLVVSHRETCRAFDKLAYRTYLGEIHGFDTVVGEEIDRDLFERGVSRPLTDSADGSLDYGGSGLYGSKGVGYRHPHVVVAVHADRDLDLLGDLGDEVRHPLRDDDAHRIGYVDGACSGVDHGLIDLDHVIELCPGCILAGELDLEAARPRVFHGLDRLLDDLLFSHLELVIAVKRTGADERVDILDTRVRDSIDITLDRTCEAEDCRVHPRIHDTGDGLALDIARYGETRLDVIDTEVIQNLGNLNFVIRAESNTWGLLPIPERGVKQLDGASVVKQLWQSNLVVGTNR